MRNGEFRKQECKMQTADCHTLNNISGLFSCSNSWREHLDMEKVTYLLFLFIPLDTVSFERFLVMISGSFISCIFDR